LIWESQEQFDAYLKSDEFKATVLDICKGEPVIETYVHTANLTDGVLI
jgi:heme-degrading monooxygenase HmoA